MLLSSPMAVFAVSPFLFFPFSLRPVAFSLFSHSPFLTHHSSLITLHSLQSRHAQRGNPLPNRVLYCNGVAQFQVVAFRPQLFPGRGV